MIDGFFQLSASLKQMPRDHRPGRDAPILVPGDRIPIHTHEGELNAEWGLIPASASNDSLQSHRRGVDFFQMASSHTYRLQLRRHRAWIQIHQFYFMKMSGGQRILEQWQLGQSGAPMTVPVLYDHWENPDRSEEKITFSMVHYPTESAEGKKRLIPLCLPDEHAVEQWMKIRQLPMEMEFRPLQTSDFHRRRTVLDHQLFLKKCPPPGTNAGPESLKFSA